MLLLLPSALPHAWLWLDSVFSPPSSVSCAENSDNLGWIGLALMAVLMGMMINAGSQALSGAFDTPKYKEFLHGHFWSMAENAILLCILATATVGLGNFGRDNIDTARAYAVLIRNTVWMDFGSVMAVNLGASLFTNVNPTIRPGALTGIYLSFQVAPMFRPIYDGLGMLMQLLVTSVLQWYAHEFMLCIAKNALLTMLLPAGLFLRSYGLKAGGNALIGVALAIYFVYPFMITQIGQAVSIHMASELSSSASPLCTGKPICCVGAWPSAVPGEPSIPNGPNDNLYNPGDALNVHAITQGYLYSPLAGGSYCTFNTFLPALADTVRNTFGSLGPGTFGAGLGAYALLKFLNISFLTPLLAVPLVTFLQYGVYQMVYVLFIVSVILPIFLVFITITMAKEIAKVLGTEIDLSALEKLI